MASAATAPPAEDVGPRGQQSWRASQRAREEAQRSNQNTSRMSRFNGLFPLGVKESASQWWACVNSAATEHAVLSFIPYLREAPTHTQTGTNTNANTSQTSFHADPANAATPVQTDSAEDPYGPRTWRSTMVQLRGKNRALNEFSVQREGEEVEENLVIMHGYGAGLGFFYKNFEGMSRVSGWKIYALDMLGMGRSTRPPFRIHAKDPKEKITEAENWFIDALEEWRIIRKIDKFTLLGHSLGGYMGVAYALKYPGHLKKLILASPAGIPEDPYAVQAEMPPDEPEESTMANEFLQDQETDIVNNKKGASKTTAGKTVDPPPQRPHPKWLVYLWDSNVSPFSLVRWGGPLGPKFVSGWTTRRFSHLPPQEQSVLHTYAYSLFKQRGSGEYALAYILAPGAFARSPLIRRIQGVGRQWIPGPTPESPKVKERGIPVVMMYGDRDWMDIDGGRDSQKKFEEEKAKATAGLSEKEKKLDRGSSKVVLIHDAGHHVYLDNADEFNDVMRQEMYETIRMSRKEKTSTA